MGKRNRKKTGKVTKQAATAAAGKEVATIASLQDFTNWVNGLEGTLLLYRGLANEAWEVEASGYRRVRGKRNHASVKEFQEYIDRLLRDAHRQGIGKEQGEKMCDLALLALLQHQGAATCLIDFTANPYIALWFACQGTQSDGKFVALDTGNFDDFAEVAYEKMEPHSINDFFNDLVVLYKDLGTGKLSPKRKSGGEQLWKWKPFFGNNRVIAQNSVFVFGARSIDPSKPYFHFVHIKKDKKQEVLAELRDRHGIDANFLFRDLAGFAVNNAHDKPIDYTAENYFRDGVAYHQKGELEKAKNCYTQAIKSDPRHALAYNARGAIRGALGDHRAALSDFGAAIGINKDYAEAYHNRGAAKNTLRKYKYAIKDFDKAIEIAPQSAEAHHGRGVAHLGVDKWDEAATDFNKAIELDPTNFDAYYRLGAMKLKRGKFSEAVGYLTQAIDKAIDSGVQPATAYHHRAVANANLNKLDEALADCDKAIEAGLADGKTYYFRNMIKRLLGDNQGAQQDAQKAKELGYDPDRKN